MNPAGSPLMSSTNPETSSSPLGPLNALAQLDARAAADSLLSAVDVQAHLHGLADWALGAGHIARRFDFPDFHHTMAFVNALAWVAHRADHHPDMEVGYNRCTVRWSTHSAGGLTLKDMICAAQVDALCRKV